MLDKKTLYTIYLAHKLNNLILEKPFSYADDDLNSDSHERIRFKSYLDFNTRITGNLTRTSIMNFITEMRNIVDQLDLPVEEQTEFPRNLRQFHQSFAKWQKTIDSTILQ